MSIPKFIYQTAKSKVSLHVALEENSKYIQAMNNGWKYRLFDDQDIEDFILNYYGRDILSQYHKINPTYGAGRADLFRYLLIYQTGGVYLDIKSCTTRALDTVLLESDEYILSHWSDQPGHKHYGWGRYPDLGPRGEYQNWHVIAAPRHPFLERTIEYVLNNIKNYNPFRIGVGKLALLRVTGPIAYTKAIESIDGHYPYRHVESENLGLKYSTLDTQSNPLAHEQFFDNHYRKSQAPICFPDFETDNQNWHMALRNGPCPCGSSKKFKHCHGQLT